MVRIELTPDGGPGLEVVAHALRSGGVAVVPSDTLYGFSARYDRPSAIRRIATIKERAEDEPFLVLISAEDELALLTGNPPPNAVLDRLWPGPVTLLLTARRELLAPLRGPAGTVAVRLPRPPIVRDLVARVGVPIVSTSVNRHGEPPLGDPQEIAKHFGHMIDVLADAGPREGTAPSTMIDLTRRPPVVVRQGDAAVDIEEINRLLRSHERQGGHS